MEFDDFGLKKPIIDGIHSMGFTKPTPIQAEAIPIILQNHDLIGCAQTGTGKTAAYLIPLMDKMLDLPRKHISCLILAPTRELVKQIDQQVDGIGYFSGLQSVTVYGGGIGGDVWDQQKNAIQTGVDVLVATPGRLMAHMKMGYVDFSHLKFLVLDEADKMLDMGFLSDIMGIIGQLPKDRQTLLFSATMPPKIRELSKQILKKPAEINIAISKPADRITQRVFMVYDKQKIPLLEIILKRLDFESMVIFASTKVTVAEIERKLNKLGIEAFSISSDIEQKQREEILLGFKNGSFKVLVATDVLSRGIDIDGISHVLNYDMPPDPEDYIHRIGRTGRADAAGVAISFVNEQDLRKLLKVESLIEKQITQLPLPPMLGKGPVYRTGNEGVRPIIKGRQTNSKKKPAVPKTTKNLR